VRPQLLRVGDVVRQAERLLRRVIGEGIALEVRAADAPPVHADPGQLEQVLMNLAVNARDAMLTPLHGTAGAGGVLAIEVDAVRLDAAQARAWDAAAPGRWVRLRVRDTGHGMDADTRAHAFEPFFTTKAVGQGTGLGLATVFGIVRQAGGSVRVDSAPGRGATFTILLPAAADGADAAAGAPAAAPPERRGTVLFAEDEAPVRAITRRLLERRGYAVLEARDGADALDVWRAHADAVDVVVTDLRMPELGGHELVARLRAERPGLPVVYVSGYSDEEGRLAGGRLEAFVEKPFAADALLGAIDRVLRAGRGDAAAGG
jgi:CheY-like chemotaxis protein